MEEGEGTYRPNCHKNLVTVYQQPCLFFRHFVNATAYQLAHCEPSSPSTKVLHAKFKLSMKLPVSGNEKS